jgi:uncharacterized protein DUF3883
MNNETCIHGGVSPIDLLKNLHPSQGGSGRHRCPICAYEQGFILGSSKNWTTYTEYCESIKDPEICKEGSIAPTSILKSLGENQGGTGRHRCTNCAFKEGFEVGILENKIGNIRLKLVPTPIKGNILKTKRFKPSKNIDFIKIEIENKKLGLLGELFIVQEEKKYLIKNGKQDLANKIIHSSLEVGDGIGYDICSYDLDGNFKYIEVKTTRSNINRPFYLTKNEIEFSRLNKNQYFLYRLFDFDINKNSGKYYQIQGDLNSELDLEPILYLANPK